MAVEPDRLFFAFRDRQTERLGGMATYFDIRPAMGAIEIGYIWFAPFMQRTAQATEALFLLLGYAFDELKYRRMQWRCNALNEKSRAAALRLGAVEFRHARPPDLIAAVVERKRGVAVECRRHPG
jgi:RimJ/RimL family protein N-acetyltransferase